jgi:hypothetical protein
VDRLRGGGPLPDRYLYGERALREELVRELPGATGELAAAVTRNAYGALVLNSARVMFVDVDLPREPAGARLLRWLRGRLLGESSPSAGEEEARRRLQAWIEDDPSRGVRVYRTPAGFRYLVTHDVFDPRAEEASRAMEALGCDPRYGILCRAQRCFRARLTPKPWRCGLRPPRVRFPFETAEEEAAMREWLERYTSASGPFAACAFEASHGSRAGHPEVAAVQRAHDDLSRAERPLPLA